MKRQFEEDLLSIDAAKWKVRQVIVFDWHDGAREGICSLNLPKSSFYFELLAERATPDDLDDRLYGLSSIPDDTVNQVIRILSDLGPPTMPQWIPVWDFPRPDTRDKAEDEIESILASRQKAAVVIHTRDMKKFLRCWNIDWSKAQIDDWFDYIDI